MTAVAPPLTTLPSEGRYVVETEHSAYVVDMDARTFERWPAAPAASVLHGDGKPLNVVDMACVVGEPMRADWRDDGGQLAFRITTPVVSIVPTP